MARMLREDQEYVWRVVVVWQAANGSTDTSCHGVFNAKNHATSAATNQSKYRGFIAATVQRAKLVWEDVETR